MKGKVRSEVRQSEFRTVGAKRGGRGGKWPQSAAPNRSARLRRRCPAVIGAKGKSLPAEAHVREDGAKQGGNTEACGSRP